MEIISNVEMEERGWMPENIPILLDDTEGTITMRRVSRIPGEIDDSKGWEFKVYYPLSHHQCASDGKNIGSAICDYLKLNVDINVKPWWNR